MTQRRYITIQPAPAAAVPAGSCGEGCACEFVAAPAAPAPLAADGVRTMRYRIEAMDCPTEEGLIRAKLGSMTGIVDLHFNLLQRVLTVYHRLDSLTAVEAAILSLGMQAQPLGTAPPPALEAAPWWPLLLAVGLALGAELADLLAPARPWLPVIPALAAIAVSGGGVFLKGWIALKNRNLNINALMSIAVTGAVLLGAWAEAAMVMALFALAERIEAASLERARRAVQSLLDLRPPRANRVEADGTVHSVEAAEVALGAILRVRPGERIALDGVVLRGRSSVDQAPITGESLPVDKGPGDLLYAGCINRQGELDMRVTACAEDTTLARIIHLVEEAQASRAPTQRFVDRFARIYTPAVFVFALLCAVLPPLLGGAAWTTWAYRALVLLVIACPCALVISTPVTIVSGLAAAARRGILIKGGAFLEQGRRLTWVAFDKTGTLTQGHPVLTDSLLLVRERADAHALAFSLTARSDHPVARAVALWAQHAGVAALSVEHFAALAGRGIEGRIGGRDYIFGNHTLIHDLGFCSAALEAQLAALEAQGKTTVLLAERGNGVLALYAVADAIKPGSRAAVAALHELGVKTLMLSGDNPQTVAAIAAQAGIDRALGNQLPQDKAQAIAALVADGAAVGMAGDGINDAPALAAASIGFAMGAAGSGAAIESADVVLMDDELGKLPAFIRLARRTSRVLRQNIALALGIKAVFLALTLLGLGSLWLAVFADMGASLLVVGNGLRLLRPEGGARG